VCGYLVWTGWFWRSHRNPSRWLSVVIWVASIIVNILWFVLLVIAAGERAFYVWWGSAVAIASMIALYFEIKSPRLS
jgi:hypothetical protein